MKSRIIALILAFLLICSVFTGCGKTETPAASETDIADDAATDATGDDAASDLPTTYVTFDYNSAFESYDPDAIVMTVNYKEITWREYFGWLFSIIEQYEMYMGVEFAWSDMLNEAQTMEQYAKYYAEVMCSQYAVVDQLAAENGIGLTEEENKHLIDLFNTDAVNYAGGDTEAFVEYLESTFMSEEYYHYINTISIYYQKLFNTMFGENGSNLSDDEVYDFIDANSYLYSKHILMLTLDDTGAALDEAAKAEKLAQAEDILSQLKACTDTDSLLAKFDKLMHAHSEDTGLASNPDGYFFLPGEMVTEFEEGTKALEYNTISEIIESPYGYHIILRLPISPDSTYQEGTTFRALAAAYAFDTMMGEEFAAAEIEYTDDFAALSLADIFSTIELSY